jgi:2-polyprenyl-3-methyl-5-hydroxy-6-metoxy-1,4-benzoquinol methylase
MFAYHPDELFDVVTHWGVLEHFAHPEELLIQSAELLKPGGYVVFGMPNMEAAGAHWWRKYAPANWAKHIFHSDERVRQACANAGLELIQVRHFHLPMIQVTAWESAGYVPKLLTLAHLGLLAIYHVVPIGHIGMRRLSLERFFAARKLV